MFAEDLSDGGDVWEETVPRMLLYAMRSGDPTGKHAGKIGGGRAGDGMQPGPGLPFGA